MFLDVNVVPKPFFSNLQVCINVPSDCLLVVWVEVLIAFLVFVISTGKDLDVIATHLRH
jgi:hypothetical protein